MRVYFALLLVAAMPGHAQDGVLSFVSDPGHFVGGGDNITIDFADEDAWFHVMEDGALQLQLQRPGFPFFHISASPAGFSSQIAPGCYERARRLREFDRPSFDVGYDARACNSGPSRFVIHELSFAAGGKISRLSMDFAHHCGEGTAMRGQIRLHSDVPVNGNYPARVFTTIGELNVVSDPLDLVGGGEQFSIPISEQNFSSWGTEFFEQDNVLVLDNRASNVTSGWLRDWDLMMRAPAGEPLGVQSYNVAENFSSGSPNLPGLCFGLDSWACRADFGSFEIRQLERDRIDGFPIRASVVFDRAISNKGEIPTWVRGSASFYTQIRSGPLVPDVIFLDGLDAQAKWPLYWPCT